MSKKKGRREGGGGGGDRDGEGLTAQKLKAHLAKASAVPTANSREMSITLPTSETFMRASGLN